MNTDIRQHNDKGERHGYWESYCGIYIFYKCTFNNDKEIGYEEYQASTNNSFKIFHII